VNKNLHIIEIESEYRRIDNEWLKLHFHTAVGLVLFAFLMECVLGVELYRTGDIKITLERYFIKYIFSPLAANAIFIIIGSLAMHSAHLAQKAKVYFISLLFVMICFVFYTVHCVFPALFLIFTVPILLTVVYGNYILTSVTAVLSVSAKIIPELFIKWDPDKINTFYDDFGLANFIISLCILGAFYAVCIVVIRFEREKNAASIQKEIERYQMQQKLHTDELTAINNRTALRKAFQSMEEDTSGNTYAFAMIDIDNFKMLNDTFGHDKGDECLKSFGSILKTNCKDATPFRFGGDEFCILFMNQTLENTVKICKNIQKDFKEAAEKEINIPMTVSFGIAQYKSEMSPAQLLKISDSALYYSKTVKDCIYIYEEKAEISLSQGKT